MITCHDQNIPITDPDYGPNPDYGVWIRIHNQNNFVQDGVKIHQVIPNFYADNFSWTKSKRKNSAL